MHILDCTNNPLCLLFFSAYKVASVASGAKLSMLSKLFIQAAFTEAVSSHTS